MNFYPAMVGHSPNKRSGVWWHEDSRKASSASGVHYAQLISLFVRVMRREVPHKHRLEHLACRVNSEIWDIPVERLDGELTTDVAFGNLRQPKTDIGHKMRLGAIGYGGVELRGGEFTVVAKAWNMPLLLHELVKGTAELVCLHGLNRLDAEAYEAVCAEADQIEYEGWMLEVGPELWRQWLQVLPGERHVAEMLMHLARLEPAALERIMLDVVENPERARRKLRELG